MINLTVTLSLSHLGPLLAVLRNLSPAFQRLLWRKQTLSQQ